LFIPEDVASINVNVDSTVSMLWQTQNIADSCNFSLTSILHK